MTHHPLHLYTKHNKYYDNVCKLQSPISNDTRIRQISETLTNKTFIPIGYQQFSDKTPLSIRVSFHSHPSTSVYTAIVWGAQNDTPRSNPVN